MDQRKSAANLFFFEAPFCPLSFRLSGSLLFPGSFGFFGLRPPGMLAGEAGLKLLDLRLVLIAPDVARWLWFLLLLFAFGFAFRFG